ncbi:MAG: copper resistance protein CopD, partial [Actinomycetes bacterium]
MALKASTSQERPTVSPGPVWLAAACAIALVVVLAATAYGRGTLPAETRDPGALVQWGYGLAQTLHNLAAAATIGGLVFAAFIIPPLTSTGRASRTSDDAHGLTTGAEHPAFTRIMVLVAVSSIIWTFSALAVLVLGFADIAGVPVSGSPEFSAGLVAYMTELPSGSAWLSVVIIAAVVATVVFGARSPGPLAAAALLAVAGLVPVILIGHASSGTDHEQATNSLGLHLVGVCLWFGGLIALTVAGAALGKDTAAVLRRFSS